MAHLPATSAGFSCARAGSVMTAARVSIATEVMVRIGRSYLWPVGDWLLARPPFKPCMRISRTRLTRWSSGRGMRHPRVLNRAAQADEAQGFEEGTTPLHPVPSGMWRQTAPLQTQPAQPIHDIPVELDKAGRRIAGAKVLRPAPEHGIDRRNHGAEIVVAPRPGGEPSHARAHPHHRTP